MATTGLTLENEVFSKFAFYAAVVLLKTVLMSVLTSTYRITRNVYISPEDYQMVAKEPKPTTDPDIERIRNCHRNDLENVLPFVLIGLLYVLTGPDACTATLVFRTFAVSRLTHTFVYVLAIRQPARVLAFAIGFAINVYMAVMVLMTAAC